MTWEQAIGSLPHNSKLTATFGYPGEGGYVEHHAAPNGDRYRLSNGTWSARPPFQWTLEKVDQP